MRVLQLTTHLNPGGIPTYVYSLSKYLSRNGIEVSVASSGGAREGEFRLSGINTYTVNLNTKNEFWPGIVFALARLRKIRREFPFDIIHSHTRAAQVLAQAFSLIFGVRHVANFHGFYRKNKKRLGRKIIKAQGKRSIAITPYVRQDLINVFGAAPQRVKTIVSGIDFERLSRTKPYLALGGCPRIGACGRLSRVKGFDYLIKAMPDILKHYPDARLYIMGKGPERDALISLAASCGISSRFELVSDIEVAQFLGAMDIFCLPSLEEPLGLSLLEAQFFGLPCVAARVRGPTILIEDELNGLLVEPAQSRQIAAAVTRLLRDDRLRERISRTAAARVRREFDLEKKVHDFIAVYRDALREE